jgi:hypothetical protein
MALFKVGDELICISIPDHTLISPLEIGNSYKCLAVYPFGKKWQIAINNEQVRNKDGYYQERFVLATPLLKALL